MNDMITSTSTMTSVQIADLIGKQHKNILADIRDESEKLAAGEVDTALKFQPSEYKDSTGRTLPCYNLTREGVLQLAARYDAVTRAKLIEMAMRAEQPKPMSSLEIMHQMLGQQIEQERQLKELTGAMEAVQTSMQDMRNVIALDPTGWREESIKLVRKIAHAWGGPEHMRDVWTEIYKLIDSRAGVSLETRLTNKRRRMAEEGVCKSKRDALNGLDIIGEDRKLVEITVHIIKQLAVKNGVGVA